MINDAQVLLDLLMQVLERGYENEDETREAIQIAYLIVVSL